MPPYFWGNILEQLVVSLFIFLFAWLGYAYGRSAALLIMMNTLLLGAVPDLILARIKERLKK
ncbi:hypothetical protein phiOC_p152 [Ochrobactrum phage vB_OspM_OC]|nr:hypothetical protein phiOC_p152 [Ochrobactrum phage vB_OspM_OC]